MAVVLLVVLVALAAGGYFVAREIRARRTPDELRGDWWPAFEREFRAYARRRPGHKRGPSGR